MQITSTKKTALKAIGHTLLGLGLIATGVSLAPLAPQAKYAFENTFENTKVTVLGLAKTFDERGNPPINHLPINKDKEFISTDTQEALSLVGQVHAATASNILHLEERNKKGISETIKKSSVDQAKTHNRIVIPKIGVDMKIIEGSDAKSSLNQGAWRIPGTSQNPTSGNMVISAHRYLYTSGPNTFYHLDKLSDGDEFMIYWGGKEYKYRVTESKIVPPTQVSILDQTAFPKITLFTCDPVFTSKNRLVKVAVPI